MNKCELCGREFYSDKELEEHKFIEATQKQVKRQVSEFNWIASALLAMNILTVQRRDHCTIELATKTFWKETELINQVWNQMFRERPGSMDGPDTSITKGEIV